LEGYENAPESESFLDHEFQQIGYAAAIAPFVVVPAHQFEEKFVQFDAQAGVEDGRGFAMDEIRAGVRAGVKPVSVLTF
jgi:hypothetical protein